MIRSREIRRALAGALVFIAGGVLQACAADALTGPDSEPAVQTTQSGETGDPPLCGFVNGVYICK